MSELTSKKNVKSLGYPIITVGYCKLQHLLKNKYPVLYNAGVYGWSCDNYFIWSNKYKMNVIISTGYRPINGIQTSYKLLELYDNLARETNDSEEVSNLLQEFVDIVLWNKENGIK